MEKFLFTTEEDYWKNAIEILASDFRDAARSGAEKYDDGSDSTLDEKNVWVKNVKTGEIKKFYINLNYNPYYNAFLTND
jgi:hypothetical protein